MKVAFVTPRYGSEVLGGAETGARMLAEHLVAELDWEVEALTTTARDASTWANSYPAGTTEIAGVRVRRFPVTGERATDFDQFSNHVFLTPGALTAEVERQWIERQGPVAPALLDAVRDSDADALAFYPYLYHPTVHGILEVADRAVLHPAAHDELPIRLPIFQSVFAAAKGLVYHTESERRFVDSLFEIAHVPQIVLGLGSDALPGEPSAARAALSLGDRPYLVCVGRVDNGKGTAMLARFFVEYKRRRPGPLALVFVGPVVHQPPRHPDIIVAGAVDEATKWGALRGAELLVSPSAYESFSLVLVEAWNAHKAVLVNARSRVTREHCVESRGGLWFDGYPEFEVALDRLCADNSLRAQLAQSGAAYTKAHYQWPGMVRRYAAFLETITETAAVSR